MCERRSSIDERSTYQSIDIDNETCQIKNILSQSNDLPCIFLMHYRHDKRRFQMHHDWSISMASQIHR
jgi:hypothetical protein